MLFATSTLNCRKIISTKATSRRVKESAEYLSFLIFLWLLYLINNYFLIVSMNASHFFFQGKESDKLIIGDNH